MSKLLELCDSLEAAQKAATPAKWKPVLKDDRRSQPVAYYQGLIATFELGDHYLAAVTQDDRVVEEEEWEPNLQLACATVNALPSLIYAVRRMEQTIIHLSEWVRCDMQCRLERVNFLILGHWPDCVVSLRDTLIADMFDDTEPR